MLNEAKIVDDYCRSVVSKMSTPAGSALRPGMTKSEAEKAIPILLLSEVDGFFHDLKIVPNGNVFYRLEINVTENSGYVAYSFDEAMIANWYIAKFLAIHRCSDL